MWPGTRCASLSTARRRTTSKPQRRDREGLHPSRSPFSFLLPSSDRGPARQPVAFPWRRSPPSLLLQYHGIAGRATSHPVSAGITMERRKQPGVRLGAERFGVRQPHAALASAPLSQAATTHTAAVRPEVLPAPLPCARQQYSLPENSTPPKEWHASCKQSKRGADRAPSSHPPLGRREVPSPAVTPSGPSAGEAVEVQGGIQYRE